jgi:hypothetical protein
MNRLDHLVIAAETLQQGVDYIRETMAVEIPPGGLHKSMATHNHLMQLGNSTYIEVIATNPDAAPPECPRWFNLDDALMRDSLHRQPRLICWVINTPNIQTTISKSMLHIGNPTRFSRDNLSWQIALTDDGRLLANGLVPYIIQWNTEQHPSCTMADLGCRLLTLDIYHNRPDWLNSVLASIRVDHLVRIHSLADSEPPYLSASIETPAGIISMDSKPG